MLWRLLAVALLVVGIGMTGTTGTTPRASAAAGLEWAACPEDATMQCASLTLPIDWHRPDGPSFELAVARRTATDPDHRIGTLLFLPGGPGISGIDFLLNVDSYFSETLQSRFDIVTFDQRGSGRSHPVECDADLVNSPPVVYPTDQGEFEELAAYHGRLWQSCRALTGPLIDYLDTSSEVRDVEALRMALGERQLSFYAPSYGSMAGQVYLEQHPDRVRVMVFDSPVDHSLGGRDYIGMMAAALEGGYDDFADWCARDESCALHGQDARSVLRQLYARADRGDLGGVSSVEIADRVRYGMYSAIRFWPGLADYLHSLQQGLPTAQKTATYSTFPVICEDWDFGVDEQRDVDALLRMQRAIAPTTRLNTLAQGDATACVGWPATTDFPQRELQVDEAPAVVVSTSQWDQATPQPWAEHIAAEIPGARLLTYAGTAHTPYLESDCMVAAIDHYLVTRKQPARGKVCRQVLP